MPNDTIHVELDPDDADGVDGDGAATISERNVSVLDFGDIVNALFGGRPPIPSTVSYDIRWSGSSDRTNIVNAAQHFRGTFVRNQAQMAWSATAGDFSFVSDPANTSSSIFAEVGFMRSGSYF